MEKNMRTTSIPRSWRSNAAALALSLAIIGFGAVAAHLPAAQSLSATALPMPRQPAAAASGFVCRALPGGWCDLRDWTRFGTSPSQFTRA